MPKKIDNDVELQDEIKTAAPLRVKGLTVFADFTLKHKTYKAGDSFTAPDEYSVDENAGAFRNVERRGKKPRGVVYTYPAGVDSERAPIFHSVILPVE